MTQEISKNIPTTLVTCFVTNETGEVTTKILRFIGKLGKREVIKKIEKIFYDPVTFKDLLYQTITFKLDIEDFIESCIDSNPEKYEKYDFI